ncbi:hypothetical protein [Aquimonas voraii]|uniref:hypothetical protein n=1 Tax=Aquimonas voraii TaxID=265719 RepID=UPI000B8159AC|nr:hypothetical protein [Aquimonas voraii]
MLLEFADALETMGQGVLAQELKSRAADGDLGFRADRYFYADDFATKEWMLRREIDGEPLLAHWRRFLARRRQAARRESAPVEATSISVDLRTKKRLSRLKQPGETWSELLNRLAATAKPKSPARKR